MIRGLRTTKPFVFRLGSTIPEVITILRTSVYRSEPGEQLHVNQLPSKSKLWLLDADGVEYSVDVFTPVKISLTIAAL